MSASLVGSEMCIRDSYRPPTQREAFILAVEAYQTSSQERQQAWHLFCALHARGTRGPARHRPELIERFFVSEDAGVLCE
eukprot:2272082-Alexandrium_andersonii.AAC.1